MAFEPTASVVVEGIRNGEPMEVPIWISRRLAELGHGIEQRQQLGEA